MDKSYNCKKCKDTGFVNKSNIWAFDSSKFLWYGVCESCDIGMDKVDQDDNFTDMKDFRKKKREL